MYPVDRTRVNEFGTTGETDSAVVPVENEILGSSQIEQSIADTTNEQHEKVE
jgi:prephenate dehydratase